MRFFHRFDIVVVVTLTRNVSRGLILSTYLESFITCCAGSISTKSEGPSSLPEDCGL